MDISSVILTIPLSSIAKTHLGDGIRNTLLDLLFIPQYEQSRTVCSPRLGGQSPWHRRDRHVLWWKIATANERDMARGSEKEGTLTRVSRATHAIVAAIRGSPSQQQNW